MDGSLARTLFAKADERTAKRLYIAGIIPILAGFAGAYYDLTYHNLNVVDTFFQPAHLIIYSSIFISLLAGIAIAIKTGTKSVAIAAAMLLSFGYGDLLWHNAMGFDSFLSPPHVALISTGIIQSVIMFRKFVQVGSRQGSIISLSTMWLGAAYLLLAFTFVSNRSSDVIYYVIAPQPIAFVATAFFFAALSAFVARMASFAKIKMLHVALIFAAAVGLAGILANPTVTLTLPLFLAGSIGPAFLYDRKPRLAAAVLGATWILAYTPYSYKLIAYAAAGRIASLASTYGLISQIAPYYPVMVALGTVSSIVTYRLLKEDRIAGLLRLGRGQHQQNIAAAKAEQ
jgi:hypothetical protein